MLDEDKIYNLLEKVYIDLQDTKEKVSTIDLKVSKIDLKVSKIDLTIENEIKPDIKLLFETQTQILTKLEEHDKKFDSIEKKLEKHDVEIRVIKGGNKKVK